MTEFIVGHPHQNRNRLIHSMHRALRMAGHATSKLELVYEMTITEIEDRKYRASFTNEYAEVYVICTSIENGYEVAAPQINKIKDIPRGVLANTVPYDPNNE